jgi:lipoprotein NlpI
MKLHLPKLILLPFIVLLTACESVPRNNTALETTYPMIVLPIATTVQIDYQDEVKLLRLNQLIAEHKGSTKEKALLYYERGLIYDRMGLTAHSRYDFTQSINTEPSFAEAYNSLGVYLLFGQSYDEAFDAFDAAIELNKNIQYSYLHRAVGLYQVKRYSLASRDINQFYELDKKDPFRVLWRYIIDSKIDKDKALVQLQNEQVADDHYAWLFIDVIAGRMSEKELLSIIGKNIKTNKEIAERLCEAYFYLGHWHKLAGNLDKAIYYFKLTSTTGIHEFIEYKYALMELASIQKELLEESTSKIN